MRRKPKTKALLYLMNYRNDSKDIFYFVIDFFNDLSGMDRYSGKIWDVQSKANSNTNSKSVGKKLVTLFKKYLSDFEFAEFILFIGGVSESFRIDNSTNIFGIENVKDKAYEIFYLNITIYSKNSFVCHNNYLGRTL